MASKLRVNREIRVKEVRLIGSNGDQVGVFLTQDALQKAEEEALDLVEISPTSNPPVCRILDFGKFKYSQNKKDHAAKLHQKGMHLKEIKLRPFTGEHDLDFKVKHARDFLEEMNKVKISLMFRGREMAHQERGREIMAHIQQALQEVGQPEFPPRMEGNCMAMVLIPKAGKEHK